MPGKFLGGVEVESYDPPVLDSPLSLVPVVALALGVWQMWLRWRAHGVDQLRDVAVEIRRVCGDVIAHHGLDASHFPDGETHCSEDRVQDLVGQLRDVRLQVQAQRLAGEWRLVFASAPAPRLQEDRYNVNREGQFHTAKVSDSYETAETKRQTQLQVSAAQTCQDTVKSVLERCNQVTRWVVP
jgi:hypothetical protein